jgi:hypothetical protein
MPLQHPLESRCARADSPTSRWSRSFAKPIGRPIAEVAKKHKVSEQTIYAWRKRFGAMEAADAKRLKTLEWDALLVRHARS